MALKRQKNKMQKSRTRRPGQGELSLKKYGLIMGIIALAIIVVAAFAILDPSRSNSRLLQQPAEVSLDKSKGANNAPVVVVEYADFQCPFCRQFAAGPERQLQKDYVDTNQVRFVFRHLAFIGPESLLAAQAAECANEQGRFWDYHDKLFEEQGAENSGAFSPENLKRFATELGLDAPQFNQCLDSGKYQAKVQQEVAEAGRLGIRSTPTLLVNGQLIRNGSDYQRLQTAIEAALRK